MNEQIKGFLRALQNKSNRSIREGRLQGKLYITPMTFNCVYFFKGLWFKKINKQKQRVIHLFGNGPASFARQRFQFFVIWPSGALTNIVKNSNINKKKKNYKTLLFSISHIYGSGYSLRSDMQFFKSYQLKSCCHLPSKCKIKRETVKIMQVDRTDWILIKIEAICGKVQSTDSSLR